MTIENISNQIEALATKMEKVNELETGLKSLNTKLEDSVRELAQNQTSFNPFGTSAVSTKSVGDKIAEEFKNQSSVFENTKHVSFEVTGAKSFLTSANGSSVSGGEVGHGGSVVYGFQNAIQQSALGTNSKIYARFNQDETVIEGSIVQRKQGDIKAQLTASLTQVQQDAITLATWSNLSRQLYKDQSQISNIVEVAHRRNLVLALDKILATGYKGEGAHDSFEGYNALATPFVKAGVSLVDAISYGIDALMRSGFNPTVVVLNPEDAIAIRIAKDKNERYLADNYLSNKEADALVGVRMVISPNQPKGTAYLADNMHSELHIIDSVTSGIYMQGEDVIRNLVTQLTETRVLPAFYSVGSALQVSNGENKAK